ncbi:MAG: cytochrome c oxidase assembly protein [Solirubrobacteraceae bacterium]|nr:cytochrome c oxidase assembly protein [Solirubrobacteraceae bacterium]
MLSVIAAAQGGFSLNPGPLFILLPITVAYVVRWRAVGAHPFRLVLFMLGMTAAVAALFTPIDTLGDDLLAMHMVQHLLMLDIAPVLCLLGLTKAIFRPATKRVIQLERSRFRWILSPKTGLIAYIGGMWFWHWPTMYNAAVEHTGVHVLEHLTFTFIGAIYWWHLISPVRDQRQLSGMGAVLYMATTKIGVGILGIGLTFVPESIYDVYQLPGGALNLWGMTAQEDQALAGVIMATEQSIVMGIALVYLVVQAIDRSEKEQLRIEKYGDPKRPKAPAGSPPPSRELY